MFEVSDHRIRERLAERRHAVLPLLLPNHRESLDVGEMMNGELGVLPQRASFPAMEAGHIEQHAQLSVLPNESVKLRYKSLVIGLYQYPVDVNGEHLPVVFFIELNWHFKTPLVIVLKMPDGPPDRQSSGLPDPPSCPGQGSRTQRRSR
jgi:hypothetical protein